MIRALLACLVGVLAWPQSGHGTCTSSTTVPPSAVRLWHNQPCVAGDPCTTGGPLPSDRTFAECTDNVTTPTTGCYSECGTLRADPPIDCKCFFPPYGSPTTGPLQNEERWLGFVDKDGDGCFEPNAANPADDDTPISVVALSGSTEYGWKAPDETWLPSFVNGAAIPGSPPGSVTACIKCAGRRCAAGGGSGNRAGHICMRDADCPGSTCGTDCCEGFCDAADVADIAANPGNHPGQACLRRCAMNQSIVCTSDAECNPSGTDYGPCGAFLCTNTFAPCTPSGTQCFPSNAAACRQAGFCEQARGRCFQSADCPTHGGVHERCVLGHLSCTGTSSAPVKYTKCLEKVLDPMALPEGTSAAMAHTTCNGGTNNNKPCAVAGDCPGGTCEYQRNQYFAQLKTDYGFTTPAIVGSAVDADLTGKIPLVGDTQVETGNTFRTYSFGGWKSHDPGTSFHLKAPDIVIGSDTFTTPGTGGDQIISLVYGQDDHGSHESIVLWAMSGCVVGGGEPTPTAALNEIRVNQPGKGPEMILIQAPAGIEFPNSGDWQLKARDDDGKGGVVMKACAVNIGSTTDLATCTGSACEMRATTANLCRQGQSGPIGTFCEANSSGTDASTSLASCVDTNHCSNCDGSQAVRQVCDAATCNPSQSACPTTPTAYTCGDPLTCAPGVAAPGRICVKDWTATPQRYCLNSDATWGATCNPGASCNCQIRRCGSDTDCTDQYDNCQLPISSGCTCASCNVPECSN